MKLESFTTSETDLAHDQFDTTTSNSGTKMGHILYVSMCFGNSSLCDLIEKILTVHWIFHGFGNGEFQLLVKIPLSIGFWNQLGVVLVEIVCMAIENICVFLLFHRQNIRTHAINEVFCLQVVQTMTSWGAKNWKFQSWTKIFRNIHTRDTGTLYCYSFSSWTTNQFRKR